VVSIVAARKGRFGPSLFFNPFPELIQSHQEGSVSTDYHYQV
jgi:hypothetical protein